MHFLDGLGSPINPGDPSQYFVYTNGTSLRVAQVLDIQENNSWTNQHTQTEMVNFKVKVRWRPIGHWHTQHKTSYFTTEYQDRSDPVRSGELLQTNDQRHISFYHNG